MSVFRFKHFVVRQNQSALKVGTDAMVFGALLPRDLEGLALDVGTGTGVLSLMLAQRNPELAIQTIELDQAAFEEANKNFNSSIFSKQIKAIHGDFLEQNFLKKFDLIFSNPPYFQQAYKSEDKQKNLARHDDSLPLFEFIAKVSTLLKPSGQFWVILPDLFWQVLLKHTEAEGFFMQEEILIYGKTNNLSRRVGCFAFEKVTKKRSTLTIRDENNAYTTDYKKLTFDFHDREL